MSVLDKNWDQMIGRLRDSRLGSQMAELLDGHFKYSFMTAMRRELEHKCRS